jgi:hypothetical protein
MILINLDRMMKTTTIIALKTNAAVAYDTKTRAAAPNAARASFATLTPSGN